MKKMFFFKKFTWLVLVLTLSLLGGCKKNDLIEEEREILYTEYNCPVVAITGGEHRLSDSKWKLVQRWERPVMEEPPMTIDYSCEDIIWHFRSDGIMTVSHDHDNLNAGEYSFHDSGPGGLRRLHIQHEGSSVGLWGLQFYNEGSMIGLGSGSPNGPGLYFVRIE